MQQLIINHAVKKSSEGSYYTIDFQVPKNVDFFTVSYQYQKVSQGITGRRKNPCIIDLGIIDSDGRFIGWSGSAKNSITVGEFSSTNGYLCEKIKSGTWKIIVGAYKVNAEEIPVKYTIDFNFKQVQLYYGDLHIHSDASDGQYNSYEIGIMAKNKGLDFIALANHNNYSENLSLPCIPGITFIPAVEWTHYKGHMNFFGVQKPFENSFVANSHSEMKELINDVKSKGAVVSVNHPECSVCPYLWQDDDAYEMMEIWNGPMRPTNVRGIKKWTELLKTGRKINAVGGSDFHKSKSPIKIGNPVTAVYSRSRSAEDLLEAIRNGHSFITSHREGPQLYIGHDEKMMGDTLTTTEKTVVLEIKAQNYKGCSLILVSSSSQTDVTGKKYIEVKTDSPFVYLKAVGKLGNIKAITNPIYIEKL